MKHTLAIAILGLVLMGQSYAAGPFGFEKGMTIGQITQVLGKDSLKKVSGGSAMWETATAPKPHSAFDKYLLVISPTDGLLKVIAEGKDIETGDSGIELREAYKEIVDAISAKYGASKDKLEGCSGSGCESSDMWMFSLREKNRYVMTYWKPANNADVSTIGVEALALGMNKGYVECTFEFDGFSKYATEQKAKQNDSF